ncbi:MAG: succinylglutamate desuccinylase/aspartoacylase family protein [Patescibacteria group bacterium]
MTSYTDKYAEYSYGKYVSELVGLAQKHQISADIIGYEEFEKIGRREPLYRLIINPKAKINFCIVAGIHGEEIAGPFAILRALQNPGKYFSTKVRYQIYPILNPTGFDLKQRHDDDDRQLNVINKKILKSKNFKEVKLFFDDIKNIKFDVFLSLHEEISNEEFYAFVYENTPVAIYEKIMEANKKYAKIFKNKTIEKFKTDKNGLVRNIHDQTFEDYFFSHKQTPISLCTETPGQLPLATRIKINLQNIKILSDYTLTSLEKPLGLEKLRKT